MNKVVVGRRRVRCEAGKDCVGDFYQCEDLEVLDDLKVIMLARGYTGSIRDSRMVCEGLEHTLKVCAAECLKPNCALAKDLVACVVPSTSSAVVSS